MIGRQISPRAWIFCCDDVGEPHLVIFNNKTNATFDLNDDEVRSFLRDEGPMIQELMFRMQFMLDKDMIGVFRLTLAEYLQSGTIGDWSQLSGDEVEEQMRYIQAREELTPAGGQIHGQEKSRLH